MRDRNNVLKGKVCTDIANVVMSAIMTDDSFEDKQNEMIYDIYINASYDSKKVIDEVFMCLCGWKLLTILNGEVK